jgi:HTH-type transcriptional regulator / antitoxin HipB
MKVGTVQDLRALVQGRRDDLGLSQAAAAARAGVSRKWLSDFESGKSTVELGKVLALLEALDLVIDVTPRVPDERRLDTASDLDAIIADYRQDQ